MSSDGTPSDDDAHQEAEGAKERRHRDGYPSDFTNRDSVSPIGTLPSQFPKDADIGHLYVSDRGRRLVYKGHATE